MSSALKDRIKAMMEARDGIEKEIEERLARLDAPGGGGRTGSLVDAEVISLLEFNDHHRYILWIRGFQGVM